MGDDLDRIKDFLTYLKSDLQDYIDNYDFLVSYQSKTKPYFVDAWEEVKTAFDRIEYNIQDDKTLLRLQENGLTGKQFDLKLHLIEKARIEYYVMMDECNSIAKAHEKEQNIDRKSALAKLFEKVRWLAIGSKKALLINDDIPLSSLIQAIPLFGDSIAEFKDAAISTLKNDD